MLSESADLQHHALATVYAFVLQCHAEKVSADTSNAHKVQKAKRHVQKGVSSGS